MSNNDAIAASQSVPEPLEADASGSVIDQAEDVHFGSKRPRPDDELDSSFEAVAETVSNPLLAPMKSDLAVDGGAESEACEATSAQLPARKKVLKFAKDAREVLPNVSTVEDAVRRFKEAKNIMVLVGAGISASCGLPDFRSSGTGIYSMVSKMNLGLPQAECLFDLEYFKDDPEPFYKFIKQLYPKTMVQPSATHRFLADLERKRKLLRVYTQNIDGLEQKAGVKKVIQCHGSFREAKCVECGAIYPIKAIEDNIETQMVPYCTKTRNCNGPIKPNITFFGEPIGNHIEALIACDAKKTDFLLVIGTSLKVAPISGIPKLVSAHVPQVSVNRDAIQLLPKVSKGFDVQLLGDCDAIVDSVFSNASLSKREARQVDERMFEIAVKETP